MGSQEALEWLSGGQKVARLVSAANNDNATLIRAGVGKLHRLIVQNAAAAVRYVKFYDKATAPASTDTPLLTIALAASSVVSLEIKIPYTLGLGYRIVTGSADNDATAPTAGDLLGMNVLYN